MKTWLGFGLLAVMTSPLAAQAHGAARVGVEGVVGVAEFTESFTSDCCGPSRGASGTSFSLRLSPRVGANTEIGGEAGATFAGRRSMKWLLVTGSITSSRRLAPWGQLGGGIVAQPGECPADGSDTSPDCETDFTLGGSVGAGLRWRAGRWLVIGLEATLLGGLVSQRERRFITRRIGLVLRLQ